MEQKVKSLSWSKINSWLTNKKWFIETYFEWKEFFETKEILFWKTLWKMLELQEFEDEDKIVTECLRNFDWIVENDKRKEEIIRTSFENIIKNKWFVKYMTEEFSFFVFSEFERRLQNFVNWVCTLWFVDNCNKSLNNIFEFKTWKTPWTDDKVNSFWQLDIYCLLTYLEKWYLPKDVQLVRFETKNNENGDIEPTGRILFFDYNIRKNEERILEWKEKIPQIFDEIQQAQKEWELQNNK